MVSGWVSKRKNIFMVGDVKQSIYPVSSTHLMSMYAVNASVPKTLVRHLVRYYADTCEDAKLAEILLDILDTPVSPELLPPKDGVISQKTEYLV